MLNRKQANIEIPQFQTTYQRSDLKLVLTRSSELSEPETTSHNTETMQQKQHQGRAPQLFGLTSPSHTLDSRFLGTLCFGETWEAHLGFSRFLGFSQDLGV